MNWKPWQRRGVIAMGEQKLISVRVLEDMLKSKHKLGLVEVWVIENEKVLKDKGLLQDINAILYGDQAKEG